MARRRLRTRRSERRLRSRYGELGRHPLRGWIDTDSDIKSVHRDGDVAVVAVHNIFGETETWTFHDVREFMVFREPPIEVRRAERSQAGFLNEPGDPVRVQMPELPAPPAVPAWLTFIRTFDGEPGLLIVHGDVDIEAGRPAT